MNDLIHVAKIYKEHEPIRFLYLREVEEGKFSWKEEIESEEIDTGVTASSIDEAMQKAQKKWGIDYFKTLGCGYKYTLPERDEIGSPALFHQMVKSYSIPGGIYQDEDDGLSIVQNASQEALRLWHQLSSRGKL
jgi:hypothetical protein